MSRNRKITSLVFNIAITLLETIALTICFCKDGLVSFQYFTVDSNIIAFFAALFYSIFTIVDLVYEQDKIPKFIDYLKYIASTFLLITVIVVVTVLIPTMGGAKAMLLDDAMIYHHVICPLLTIVSYTFIEKQNIYGWKNALIPFAFVFVYGVLMVSFNISGLVDGPYPFLKVSENSIWTTTLWLSIMLIGSYVFGLLLNIINKKTTK